LFFAPQQLKHRVLLPLIYSAGMRVGEVCNPKISAIDSDRMQGICGLNRPSTKALGAKSKIPKPLVMRLQRLIQTLVLGR
jgi:integrase